MLAVLKNISNFINCYWLWFFLASIPYTIISVFFLYISITIFNPDAVLTRMRWSRPPDVVDDLEIYIYILSVGFITSAALLAIFPIFYLFFLRFNRNGRV